MHIIMPSVQVELWRRETNGTTTAEGRRIESLAMGIGNQREWKSRWFQAQTARELV